MVRELGLGGTERQLTEIAKNLDRSQFQPHAGCFRSEGFRVEELRAAGVPVAAFPVRSFRSLSLLTGALELGRYLREHRIQLVHAFDVPAALFGVAAARAHKTPVVLSSQRAHRSLAGPVARRLLRITDLLADAVVVNCKAVERHLAEEGLPASRVRLCYNGIDTHVFRPAEKRRVPALDGASLVIGTVCALRPEKSLVTLLDAFSRVRHLKPGLRLVIAGSGPERARLEQESRSLGIGGTCLFVPATEDVAGWLRALDIFVLPSLSEALSNSLMEAMACGCAVVASSAGGNPELVVHARTGLLFRAGDAADLATNLRLLIQQDTLRKSMAEQGARFIRENFSVEASARRMAEIYRAELERKAATAASATRGEALEGRPA